MKGSRLVKPGARDNTALHASTAAGNAAFLKNVSFPVHSRSFFFFLSFFLSSKSCPHFFASTSGLTASA